MWDWPNSKITRVIDGDSVDAIVTRDVGFGIKTLLPIRLRLNRINAASKNTVKGKAATARVRELIEGKTVNLSTIKAYKYGNDGDETQEQDGEWMAEISTAEGNLSDLLVSEKLAVYWDGEGPRPE